MTSATTGSGNALQTMARERPLAFLGAAAAAGALTRMALRTVARTRRAIKGES
ncbi:MAG: hypothetical protein M9886_13605 [Candidatus Nanopelagicales bacterium]|nr:hypothetical protein [Candidatus Nanopelagicales bacterium]